MKIDKLPLATFELNITFILLAVTSSDAITCFVVTMFCCIALLILYLATAVVSGNRCLGEGVILLSGK